MLTESDRHRLASILGMLGSDQAGERDSAAIKAEEFRNRYNLTWEELLSLPPIVKRSDGPIVPPKSSANWPPWPTPPPGYSGYAGFEFNGWMFLTCLVYIVGFVVLFFVMRK